MKPNKSRNSALVRELVQRRVDHNLSQKAFWARFGISQANASRIETTAMLSPSLSILLQLYAQGVIPDERLAMSEARE
ncbi:hypothetical protein [Pseudomonas sp. KNUC1026]|uniref:hypothetical protein n=1 Tax=Pseudomonas sp. KNUC1026 TaxID=2893890 RepID=UPI001F452CD0|nr:hypothetical protein [Pseudomonas sp. KNUC1026]UFH50570.1 hypothetical protein LN139_04965 [Pseudomonas sp. KNUC1026]